MAKKIMKSSGNVNATAKKINNKFMSVMTIIALCVILASTNAYSQWYNISMYPSSYPNNSGFCNGGTVGWNGVSNNPVFTITSNYGWYLDSIAWNGFPIKFPVSYDCSPKTYHYTPTLPIVLNNFILVVFKRIPGIPTITSYASYGGSIIPPTVSSNTPYTTVNMDVIANPGWRIASIQIDGANINIPHNITYYQATPTISHTCHSLSASLVPITESWVHIILGNGGSITVPNGISNGGTFINPATTPAGTWNPHLTLQPFIYPISQKFTFFVQSESCYEIESITTDVATATIYFPIAAGITTYQIDVDMTNMDHSIRVVFRPKQLITINTVVAGTGGGTITPNSPAAGLKIPANQAQLFDICPERDYDIDWVKVNGIERPDDIIKQPVGTCYDFTWIGGCEDYDIEVKFAKVWNIMACRDTYDNGIFETSNVPPITVKEGASPGFVYRTDALIIDIEVYDFATGITVSVPYDMTHNGIHYYYSFILENVDGDKEIQVIFQ